MGRVQTAEKAYGSHYKNFKTSKDVYSGYKKLFRNSFWVLNFITLKSVTKLKLKVL